MIENLLKLAQFIKITNDLHKENYRSVSVLSHVSMVFKRTMYNQIYNFMKDF